MISGQIFHFRFFLYLLSRSNVMGIPTETGKSILLTEKSFLLVKDFLSQISLATIIGITLIMSWLTQWKRISSNKGHFTPKFSFLINCPWCCKENLRRDVFHPTTRSRQIALRINFTILSSSQFLLNPSHSISCALFYIFHFEFWWIQAEGIVEWQQVDSLVIEMISSHWNALKWDDE